MAITSAPPEVERSTGRKYFWAAIILVPLFVLLTLLPIAPDLKFG